MRYDWDAAAAALSRQFGAEEGSRYEFAGDTLFPELIIPHQENVVAEAKGEKDIAASEKPEDDTSREVAEVTSVVPDRVGDPGQPLQELAAADSPAATASNSAATVARPGRGDAPVAGLTPSSPSSELMEDAAEADASPATFRGMFWVAVGLLGALVALFGATLVVLPEMTAAVARPAVRLTTGHRSDQQQFVVLDQRRIVVFGHRSQVFAVVYHEAAGGQRPPSGQQLVEHCQGVVQPSRWAHV